MSPVVGQRTVHSVEISRPRLSTADFLERLCELVVKEGVVEVVVAAAAYPKELQDAVCSLLSSLSHFPSNRPRMLDAGTIPFMISLGRSCKV
jgi:hypothetical protein